MVCGCARLHEEVEHERVEDPLGDGEVATCGERRRGLGRGSEHHPVLCVRFFTPGLDGTPTQRGEEPVEGQAGRELVTVGHQRCDGGLAAAGRSGQQEQGGGWHRCIFAWAGRRVSGPCTVVSACMTTTAGSPVQTGSVRVEIYVRPGASATVVGGEYGGAMVVRVVEPPDRGRRHRRRAAGGRRRTLHFAPCGDSGARDHQQEEGGRYRGHALPRGAPGDGVAPPARPRGG